jgi:hypothetical protein
MDVNSKEAERWAMTLSIAEIIHEGIHGTHWPEATTVAADIVARVIAPKLAE